MFVHDVAAQAGKAGCLPQDAAIGWEDAKRDFLAYLDARPEGLENSAGLVVAFALIASHPC
jgi:hypothetical protein